MNKFALIALGVVAANQSRSLSGLYEDTSASQGNGDPVKAPTEEPVGAARSLQGLYEDTSATYNGGEPVKADTEVPVGQDYDYGDYDVEVTTYDMYEASPVSTSYDAEYGYYGNEYDDMDYYGGEWEEDKDWDDEDDDEYDFSMIEDWTGEELSEDEKEQLTEVVDGISELMQFATRATWGAVAGVSVVLISQ